MSERKHDWTDPETGARVWIDSRTEHCMVTGCKTGDIDRSVARFTSHLASELDKAREGDECYRVEMEDALDMANAESSRLKAELQRARDDNSAAAVCQDHIEEFVGTGCLVCDVIEANAEIARLKAQLAERNEKWQMPEHRR